MANVVGRLGFKLVSVAVGIPVGIYTRKAVEKAWLSARPDDPPRLPSDPRASWADALGWAALSAVGVAAAELIRIKGAAEVWRILIGDEPPLKEPSEKDLAKERKKAGV